MSPVNSGYKAWLREWQALAISKSIRPHIGLSLAVKSPVRLCTRLDCVSDSCKSDNGPFLSSNIRRCCELHPVKLYMKFNKFSLESEATQKLGQTAEATRNIRSTILYFQPIFAKCELNDGSCRSLPVAAVSPMLPVDWKTGIQKAILNDRDDVCKTKCTPRMAPLTES